MRYKHWSTELRKAKPYQLDQKLEELFFEKSVTGAQAWNRLFDETMSSLKFEVDGETLADRGHAAPARTATRRSARRRSRRW